MNELQYIEFYNKIYLLLKDVTPLRADCGILCGKACCKGNKNQGMLLFPHEKTSLELSEANGRRLAVCDGTCTRSKRPLSCMIFPFFPTINEKGKIEVKLDYRGVGVCPLIENAIHVEFNPKFQKALKKAGKMLAKDEECRKFMIEITEETAEAEKLHNLIKGE